VIGIEPGAFDAGDGGDHARIVVRAESDLSEDQQRGIHLVGAVVLGEMTVGCHALRGDLLRKRPVAGMFEQQAVSVAAEQPDSAVAVAPGQVVRSVQSVHEVLDRLEILDHRGATVAAPR